MKRKLKGLLSLWLAVLMVLYTAAVFAETESETENGTESVTLKYYTGDVELYIGAEVTDLTEASVSADTPLNDQDNNLSLSGDKTHVGWRLWATDEEGRPTEPILLAADDYIPAVIPDGYEILEAVYQPEDGFDVMLYTGTEALVGETADSDATDSERSNIINTPLTHAKFDFSKKISEQNYEASLSIPEDKGISGWNFWRGVISGDVLVSVSQNVQKGNDEYLKYNEFFEYDDTLISYNIIEPILKKLLTITFDANGGEGETTDETVVKVFEGSEYTLPECEFEAPDNKTFDCWRIGDEKYEVGDKITINTDTAIKAIWKSTRVATPEFTPDGGKFTTSSLDVKIKCATSGATIYYTTDGSDPATSSTRKEYNGKVVIKTDTTIRAYAEKDGYDDSSVAEAFFDRRSGSGGGTGSSGSSGGYGSTTSRSYTVKFDTNGGLTVASQYITKDKTVKEPEKVTKYGYTFEGWYTDEEFTDKYDFSTPVTKSFTLYAKWSKENGNTNTLDGASDNRIILTIGSNIITIFGNPKTMDVAPKIVNDRTMLPARHVAEALGALVEWNETEPNKVRITKNDIEIIIYIGSDVAYVNGEAITLDSVAFLENDRTYTPVRFICENLGASVDWEEGDQKAIIEVNN